VELLDSIGDSELTVGLLMVPMVVKWSVGAVTEAMELSQRAIDASGGDPTMGNVIVGSPLAFALVMRASARCALAFRVGGGLRRRHRARSQNRQVHVLHCRHVQVHRDAELGAATDDDALRDTAEALEIAKQFGDDFTLTNAEFTRGSFWCA